MKLFISPHNDDECLWGSFTILRHQPVVAVVLDSFVQAARGHQITWERRRFETQSALCTLRGYGAVQLGDWDSDSNLQFLGFRDDQPAWNALTEMLRQYGEPETVWAPAHEEGGHEHHNVIGDIAAAVFPRVTRYMTYTKAGKSVGVPVPFEPEWPIQKLRALSCYESQIKLPSTAPHFMRGIDEYYAA